MRKLVKIIIGISISLGVALPPAETEAATVQPDIKGEFGVAIDATTGEILYDKKANQQGYPASITKVLTAIVLDENIKADEKITASATAVKQDPSNQAFLLKEGEQFSKEDALNAMMIKSSNDVTYAAAEKVAGSVEGFAVLMNKRAKEIGAVNSHFVTPNGLHDDRHVTTPYDIALITKEAMKYPTVIQAMGTKEDVIHTNQREVRIVNRSEIHDNPLALGGKTGFTNKARNTLVEILQKDGKTVIAVVMKTSRAEEYNDIAIMGNYAFDKLLTKQIITTDQVMDTKEVEGQKVSLLAAEDFVLTYGKDEEPEYETKIETIDLKQGFKEGDFIGNLNILKDGKVIKLIPLKSDTTITVVKSTNMNEKEDESGSKVVFMVLVGFCLLLAVYPKKRNRKSGKRYLG
ncbi:D-alanyl-D-alanine carboxypeptidase family protein [Bacillus sp. CECT 9360]|uniref:D-alanyl-D-alanine carboxypeptidase family protein n=1 Tax=Bacillus sp. CECT 9360 TaxID=2845821 RepID=UPI001E34D478|nr:D-alanyl-D-alanine carboxypeptidase family protein [Bacillus sp. CECT 9360]CAH0346043.1 D-alanyl-D-alanine carboxypeptidase DacB [Bacillus sp. CECT 9360]